MKSLSSILLESLNKLNKNNLFIEVCKKGSIKIVKLLIDKGADVNAKNNDGWTALIWASRNGYTEIAKLLIDKGADVNAKNNYVWTALMLASRNGYKKVVELLKQYGAKE